MIKMIGDVLLEPPIMMYEETDPVELARASVQDERFRRNLDWFEAHVREIGDKCRGKVVCIAGQELYVADTAEEAMAQAKSAHPEDDGRFVKYIHREKGYRIYAHCGSVAPF